MTEPFLPRVGRWPGKWCIREPISSLSFRQLALARRTLRRFSHESARLRRCASEPQGARNCGWSVAQSRRALLGLALWSRWPAGGRRRKAARVTNVRAGVSSAMDASAGPEFVGRRHRRTTGRTGPVVDICECEEVRNQVDDHSITGVRQSGVEAGSAGRRSKLRRQRPSARTLVVLGPWHVLRVAAGRAPSARAACASPAAADARAAVGGCDSRGGAVIGERRSTTRSGHAERGRPRPSRDATGESVP